MQENELYIEIGYKLRSIRIKRNLTLDKISEKTKISIQNLENIEEGRLDLLPGAFYQKSFIKTYANALRVSDKKSLNLINSLFTEDQTLKPDIKVQQNEITIIKNKIPTFILGLCFVGFVLIFVVNYFQNNINKKVVEPILSEIKPKVEKIYPEVETVINEIQSLKRNDPLKQTKFKTNDFNNLNLSNALFKEIIATEDVWIEIKDNNNIPIISTILKKNESFRLPSDNVNLIISASNAGVLQIKDGNNELSKLGSFGTVLNSDRKSVV